LFFWQKNLQHEDTKKPSRAQRKIKIFIIRFLVDFTPALCLRVELLFAASLRYALSIFTIASSTGQCFTQSAIGEKPMQSQQISGSMVK
jgi:hypothetical protein